MSDEFLCVFRIHYAKIILALGGNVLLCPVLSFNVPICPDKGKKGRKILVQMVKYPYL